MSEARAERSWTRRHMTAGRVAGREVSADLLRIIACLIVIGNHCSYPAAYEPANAFSRTLVSTFYSDGVSMFYFLAGFFSFYPKEKPYLVHLKGLVKRIIVPLFVTLFVYILLGEFATGQADLADSIAHGLQSLDTFVQSVFYWENKCPYSGHLWYLFVYSFLMLWYPFIAAGMRWVMEQNRWRTYLVALFALLVYNDLTRNNLLQFAGHTFNGAASAFLFVLAGGIFWQHRDVCKKPVFLLVSPTLFVLVNALRATIQLHRWGMGIDNNSILYYYSSFGFVCVLLTAAFCVSLSSFVKEGALKSLINVFAELTFPIYLVHLMVRSFLSSRGVFAKIAALVSINDTSTAIPLFVYTTICGLLVTVICLCLCAPTHAVAKRIACTKRGSK